MNVTAQLLELKVNKINTWLQATPINHADYWENQQKRNYYVNKLCEMDKYNLDIIKI
ncbi:hypothetical protein PL373_16050 [Tenacibaculum maritimum]|nr:hypothetical protein [Tenacibaculum maritimum]MDB0611274.1 hypothetical protein [Tenacibaculum maritimum]